MESIRRDVTYEKISFRGFGHCYCRHICSFIYFVHKQRKIDVKYNLSAPIPIPSEKYSVQQLKIQNVGNAIAENLVITLNGNIQKYEIKKYSGQDNIQEFELSDNIGKQICYSKLPKEGSIVITMNISAGLSKS